MANNANIYPKSGDNPTISNSDASRPNIGVCFSGGGSRALTCAWGQLLGLSALNLIGKARYISSVSGGTWASSIYSYLPDNITDDDLLGAYYPPEKLSLADGAGNLNVNNLSAYSLGQAPAGMGVEKLIEWAVLFLLFNSSSDYKWLWADIVANFILEPYGLRYKGEKSWSSSKNFSLSTNYAANNFPPQAPSLGSFLFVRSGRPFIVMNNNIMEKVEVINDNICNYVQLPNQVSPVSGGAQGQTPGATIIGGGSVESYGYSSTLDQESADASPVEVTISQLYSLIDIVSTSSAFFAYAIASYIQAQVSDPQKKTALINRLNASLKPEHKKTLLEKAEADALAFRDMAKIIEKYLEDIVLKDLSFLDKIIPTYNYWPIGKKAENNKLGFTDGGTLDNTGIIGLLAQTDTGGSTQASINLVVFDNTDTPLEKKNGKIIAASQAAPLFGIDFNSRTGAYKPFTDAQKNPADKNFEAASLIAVFDNSADSTGNTPFDHLVNGLYSASCGASNGQKPDDSQVNSEPAFYQIELTTVDNSLANITARRSVNLMYVQNAKIMNWQNNIGDESLKNEILEGQESPDNPFGDFNAFPYYNTFFKIGLKAKESNALSQMWAWAISDDSSLLKNQLIAFINKAS